MLLRASEKALLCRFGGVYYTQYLKSRLQKRGGENSIEIRCSDFNRYNKGNKPSGKFLDFKSDIIRGRSKKGKTEDINALNRLISKEPPYSLNTLFREGAWKKLTVNIAILNDQASYALLTLILSDLGEMGNLRSFKSHGGYGTNLDSLTVFKIISHLNQKYKTKGILFSLPTRDELSYFIETIGFEEPSLFAEESHQEWVQSETGDILVSQENWLQQPIGSWSLSFPPSSCFEKQSTRRGFRLVIRDSR